MSGIMVGSHMVLSQGGVGGSGSFGNLLAIHDIHEDREGEGGGRVGYTLKYNVTKYVTFKFQFDKIFSPKYTYLKN